MRATTVILLALATLGAAAQGGVTTWDFQGDAVEAPPRGFSFARTGEGRGGKWVVRADPTAPAGDHVLAQIDEDRTDHRFPLAIADGPVLKDVRVEVACKPVSGRTDRACGLVLRYRDENDYYVARANALEDNVRLYRVVNGRRTEIAGWNGKVAANVWHTLAVQARGRSLAVSFDGEQVLDAKDDTFTGAGKVGLWTKADSVTHFDALRVEELR